MEYIVQKHAKEVIMTRQQQIINTENWILNRISSWNAKSGFGMQNLKPKSFGIYCPNTCRWGDNDKAVQTCSNNKWLECRLARFDHLRSRKTKLFFFLCNFFPQYHFFFLYKWAPFQCINSICQMLYISFGSPIKNADKCAL